MSSHRKTLSIARCFSESTGAYHRNPLTFLLAAIVTYVLSLCSLFVLAGPLEAGFTIMILQVIRGQEVRLRDLFRHFKLFRRLVMLGLVRTTVELLLLLPVLSLHSPQSPGLQTVLVGGAIVLVPGLLIGAWWLYVYVLAVDQDLRFGDSFRESFRTVNRNGFWIHLALLVIVLVVGTVVPMFARGHGFVFTLTCVLAPLAIGLVASAYHQICDE